MLKFKSRTGEYILNTKLKYISTTFKAYLPLHGDLTDADRITEKDCF